MTPTCRGYAPRKVGDNPLRQQFVTIRNVAECPKCEIKGMLKLTGRSLKVPMLLKCGRCDFLKGNGKAEEAVAEIIELNLRNRCKKAEENNEGTVDESHGNSCCHETTKRLTNMEKRIVDLETMVTSSSRKVLMLEAKVRALEEENRSLKGNESERGQLGSGLSD